MAETTDVSLATLMGGLAVERFDDALQELLKNIVDPNTPATAKRSIKLDVTFKPDKNRDMGNVEIAVTSKLAPAEKVTTRVFIAMTRNGPVATESNPNQPVLPEMQTAGTNVTPLRQNGGN